MNMDALKDTNIKIVEIAPPTVATNLHRNRWQQERQKPNVLSVQEFKDFLIKVGKRQGHDWSWH